MKVFAKKLVRKLNEQEGKETYSIYSSNEVFSINKRAKKGLQAGIMIQPMYEFYKEGMTLQEIMYQIKATFEDIEKSLEHSETYTPNKNVFVGLMNYMKNEKEFKRFEHERFLDLAVFCYMRMPNGTIAPLKAGFKEGLETETTIVQLGINNSIKEFPAEIKSMETIFLSRAFSVSTKDNHMGGAAVILYPDVLENIAKKMEGNYYILPISICWVIAVKDDRSLNEIMDYKEHIKHLYKKMLSLIPPEEFLSDNIYYFDQGKGELEII